MKKIVLTVMSAFILFAFSGCTLCTLSGELNGFYDKISKQKRNNPVKQRKTQHFPQKKDPKYYDFTTQG